MSESWVVNPPVQSPRLRRGSVFAVRLCLRCRAISVSLDRDSEGEKRALPPAVRSSRHCDNQNKGRTGAAGTRGRSSGLRAPTANVTSRRPGALSSPRRWGAGAVRVVPEDDLPVSRIVSANTPRTTLRDGAALRGKDTGGMQRPVNLPREPPQASQRVLIPGWLWELT